MRRVSFRILLFIIAFAVGYGVFYLWLDRNTPKVEEQAINNSFQNVMMRNYRPLSERKLNMFSLVIRVDEHRQIKINDTDFSNLDNLAVLKKILAEVFIERKINKQWISNENKHIDRTVTIRQSGSLTSEDFLNLVEALNEIGANPIQVDDFYQKYYANRPAYLSSTEKIY